MILPNKSARKVDLTHYCLLKGLRADYKTIFEIKPTQTLNSGFENFFDLLMMVVKQVYTSSSDNLSW